jgi:transposase
VSDTFEWLVGVDWGSEAHAVCLLDGHGQIRGTRMVAHTAIAVHEAIRWVCDQTGARPAGIAVGIETPRGVLVDTLIEQGFTVFALNPKQLDRFRDRFTTAGAKDDHEDAHVLADALRTDRRAFRRVRADDPVMIELREVTRLREDLLEDERRVSNRLRDQLYRVDAAWLMVSPAADEPWLWALLGQVPDPARWAALSRKRVTATLRAHRIRRLTADQILEALAQPRLSVAPGVTAAVKTRIAALVAQLPVIHQQRLVAERQIDQLLAQLATVADAETEPREHRDIEILQSLPGVGRIVTATMLTEATGAMADRDYLTRRSQSGAAPVTTRSGKRACFVPMRHACKQPLRDAVYHWARTSTQRDLAARAYYDRLRARGHSHARALRSVGDRWLRILIAMLKAGALYDPTRFAVAAEATA